MKRKSILMMAGLFSLAFALPLQAQTSAFTYQGRLTQNGSPASGSYDLRFTLYDAASNGNVIGDPQTNSAVAVSNGLFTATLDFGANAFTGGERWLGIGVVTNGGGVFTNLSPRQPITGAPYAVQAVNAMTVDMGTISNPQFVGTTTNHPSFELYVDGMRALRMEDNGGDSYSYPDSSGAPNLIGGCPNNSVASGVVGATIGGGGSINFYGYPDVNTLDADYSTISGGLGNHVANEALAAIIGGGIENNVESYSESCVIGGGDFNRIKSNSLQATIGGGGNNQVHANSTFATISGGGINLISSNSMAATIGGGYFNTLNGNASYSTIGGGNYNVILSNSPNAVISGGVSNQIASSADSALIGGGYRNGIGPASDYSVVGGGTQNMISSNSPDTVIAGGVKNSIGTNCSFAAIGGGNFNHIGNNSEFSTISGGQNGIGADAPYSTIPGGYENGIGTGAAYSFVAGRLAKANYPGCFVWADSQNVQYSTTSSNQFLIRASGGVGINTQFPYQQLTVESTNQQLGLIRASSGKLWTMEVTASNALQIAEYGPQPRMTILPGGNVGIATTTPGSTLDVNGIITCAVLNQTSDRNAKENFASIDPEKVLQKVVSLPISRWNYKQDPAPQHLGPMAQDFHQAFGLNGTDDKHITTVDESGVALAAIQGLNQKLEQKETEITELKQRLAKIESLLNQKLNKNGGTE